MNLTWVISVTKSNKTNENEFIVKKSLFHSNFFLFSKSYLNNREIKINLAHLHALFYNASRMMKI